MLRLSDGKELPAGEPLLLRGSPLFSQDGRKRAARRRIEKEWHPPPAMPHHTRQVIHMNRPYEPPRRGTALWLTVTAVLTSMTVVLSMSVFSIPVPGGHLYFCDTIINIAATLLDPLAAFIVGGIGSFLGDFFFYPAPMFVSLVTHGLQAVLVSVLSKALFRRRPKPVLASSIACAAGAAVMIAGYTFGRAFVYATMEVSLVKLPFECVQGIFGAVLAVVILYPMRLRAWFQRLTGSGDPRHPR